MYHNGHIGHVLWWPITIAYCMISFKSMSCNDSNIIQSTSFMHHIEDKTKKIFCSLPLFQNKKVLPFITLRISYILWRCVQLVVQGNDRSFFVILIYCGKSLRHRFRPKCALFHSSFNFIVFQKQWFPFNKKYHGSRR